MTQKQFVLIFVGILIIASLWLGFSRFQQTSFQPSVSPAPSDNILSDQSNTQSTAQPQTQKQIKQYSQFPGELSAEQLENKKAVITTNKGVIEFEVYPEATKSASNFILLAQDKFYDGLTFHRVEPNFVIQGGDPLGSGIGGPGYTFKEDTLVYKKYDKGVVAYAKKGNEPAGTGGSQFFIMLADTPLPPEYAIFGKVIKGQEVVDKIRVGDVMNTVTIEPL